VISISAHVTTSPFQSGETVSFKTTKSKNSCALLFYLGGGGGKGIVWIKGYKGGYRLASKIKDEGFEVDLYKKH
jgi:hypothetical protein